MNCIAPSGRRRFLIGSMAAAAAPWWLDAPAAPAPDIRSGAEGQVRLRSALDGSAAVWSYSGTIYAVRPDQRPIPILAVSGCQTEWARRLGDGSYRLAGMLLGFFRDPGTGEFLDQWDNPFTGRKNEVRPNRFAGGSALYPADGTAMRIEGQIAASESAPQGFGADNPAESPGLVQWSLTADKVFLRTDHSFNVRLQPQLEAQTHVADRAAFFDPAMARVPATYTASTIIPWMRWMDMQATPGHLLWHTSGEKFFSFDWLPPDNRRQAGSAMTDLAMRPKILGR